MFFTSKSFKAESTVRDIKARLDWGEPAFTIIDVRSRSVFNAGHIVGAIPLALGELVDRSLTSLELTRNIYVYGDTDEQSAEAVALLKEAGYQNVGVLIGGLAAWQSAGYPTNGNAVVAA